MSYGLAFMGLFEPEQDHCREALRAAQLLLKYLVHQRKLDEKYIVYGIRQVRPFNSPTNELYDAIKTTWPDHWVSTVNKSLQRASVSRGETRNTY